MEEFDQDEVVIPPIERVARECLSCGKMFKARAYPRGANRICTVCNKRNMAVGRRGASSGLRTSTELRESVAPIRDELHFLDFD